MPCPLEELPPDVQQPFRELLDGGRPPQSFLALENPRSPEQLRRAYWVAQGGTALAIGASIVLAVWSSLALDLTRGLMLGLPALFVSVLLQWIWAGPHKQLARDPAWRCGLASAKHLVMREEGSIRYVDLEPFDGVRVQVFKTEGIEDRKIVLCSQEGELAWGGLEYFGADVVGEFAFQLHKQLQAASQLRMISSMDIIELVAWFAQGGEPTQPLRFCHATEQGLQGGQTLEVSSDGRASASRWDPVAGQAIPISQATLPVDKVRELARVWVALAPSFPHLPPFVPSSAGTLVFSVRHAEQRVELQLSGEAYDHATTRALRDAFGAIGQLLSS